MWITRLRKIRLWPDWWRLGADRLAADRRSGATDRRSVVSASAAGPDAADSMLDEGYERLDGQRSCWRRAAGEVCHSRYGFGRLTGGRSEKSCAGGAKSGWPAAAARLLS